MTMYDMPPEVSAEPACQSQITAAEVTPPPHGRRYYTFDFLKLVCAFLIVCIHALMPGEAGFVSLSLARVAVPTFFAVTGFFYQRTVDRNGGLRQIRKIVLLLVGSVLLYTFWENLLSLHYNGTFAKPQGDIWQYLFLNIVPYGSHIWYLSAVLYVLLAALVFDKLSGRRVLWALAPVLLVFGYIIGQFPMRFFGRELPVPYVRNFLLTGIPFFCLGDMLAAYERPIVKRVGNNVAPLVMAGVFAALSVAEAHLYVKMYAFWAGSREMFVSTFFLVLSLMLACMCADEDRFKKNPVLRVVSAMGRRYSTTIYIVHIIVLNCLDLEGMKYGYAWNTVYMYAKPLLVFLLSLGFAAVYDAVISAMRNFFKKIKKRA